MLCMIPGTLEHLDMSCQLRDASIPNKLWSRSIDSPRAKLPARNSNAPWFAGALKASNEPIPRLHPWVKDGTWPRKLKQTHSIIDSPTWTILPSRPWRQHRRVQVCQNRLSGCMSRVYEQNSCHDPWYVLICRLSPAISRICLDFPTRHLCWQHGMMATFYASGASSRGETTLTLCLTEAMSFSPGDIATNQR